MNKYTFVKVVIAVTIIATAYAPPDRLLSTVFGNTSEDPSHPPEMAEQTIVQEFKSKSNLGHTIVRRDTLLWGGSLPEPKPGYFLNGDSKVEFNATIKLKLERLLLQQQINKTAYVEEALLEARRKIKELEIKVNNTQGSATIEILKDIIKQTARNATLLLERERVIANATITQLLKENEDLKIRSKEVAVSIIAEVDKNATLILQEEMKIASENLQQLQNEYDELKTTCEQKDAEIEKIESCCEKKIC